MEAPDPTAHLAAWTDATSHKDPYAVLGLDPSASAAEINAAFRRLSMLYHPDRRRAAASSGSAASATDAELDSVVFSDLARAFETLGDPIRREAFDAGGHEGLAMLDRGKSTPTVLQPYAIEAQAALRDPPAVRRAIAYAKQIENLSVYNAVAGYSFSVRSQWAVNSLAAEPSSSSSSDSAARGSRRGAEDEDANPSRVWWDLVSCSSTTLRAALAFDPFAVAPEASKHRVRLSSSASFSPATEDGSHSLGVDYTYRASELTAITAHAETAGSGVGPQFGVRAERSLDAHGRNSVSMGLSWTPSFLHAAGDNWQDLSVGGGFGVTVGAQRRLGSSADASVQCEVSAQSPSFTVQLKKRLGPKKRTAVSVSSSVRSVPLGGSLALAGVGELRVSHFLSPYTRAFASVSSTMPAIRPELEVGASQSLDELTRVNCSVQLSARSGLSLILRLKRGWASFAFPIHISSDLSPKLLAVAAIMPITLYAGLSWATRSWRRERRRQRLEAALNEAGVAVLRDRALAQRQQRALSEAAAVARRREADRDGLVVLEAVYGHEIGDHVRGAWDARWAARQGSLAFPASPEVEDMEFDAIRRNWIADLGLVDPAIPGSIDVASVLQTMVDDRSRLVLEPPTAGSAGRCDLPGFCNTHPGLRKLLYVRFRIHSSSYEAVFADHELVALPDCPQVVPLQLARSTVLEA